MTPLLWGAIGVGLIAAELVIPGIFLIWFGGAAVLTGVAVALSGGWGLVNEAALFTAAAGAAVCIAIVRSRSRNPTADAGAINDRAAQLRGRPVVLNEPIVNGRGRLFIGDTLWSIEGPDRPAGAAMIVTGHNGMMLTVADAASAPSAASQPAPTPPSVPPEKSARS